MPRAAKLAYRPVGIASGMLGGLVAGMVFKQVWKRVSDEEDAPGPLKSTYGWREMLVAAAIQGMIYAVVKSVVDRVGAKGFERMTGEWPGE